MQSYYANIRTAMTSDDELIAAAMSEITENLGVLVSVVGRIVDQFSDTAIESSEISTGDNDQGDRASHHYDYHGIYFY